MFFDLIYFILFLSGLQLPQYWDNLPGGGFIVTFEVPLFWILCAALGFSYPFVPKSPRTIKSALRLVTVLWLSSVVDFIIYRYAHPDESFDVLWRVTLIFVIPSSVLTFFGVIAGAAIKKSRSDT
jgi:FtsH-binding integral membrane protein